SGANVSILPLSSPSLRLSQIRRRKKCTRDDMFSELMQSSHTDRAQLNAWLVAEARKAFGECDRIMQEEMLRLIGEQTDMNRHLVELLKGNKSTDCPCIHFITTCSPHQVPYPPRPDAQERAGRLRAPSHSTSEDGPGNRRLSFYQL
ncbi:hypothetical protein G0U57_014234, partial [Chelydra serpentina]